MVKGTKRDKKKQYYAVNALIIVCIAVILLGGVGYIHVLRSNLMDQAVTDVMDMTRQQQQAFHTFISADRERLHSFAVYFSQADSQDTEGINEKLEAFSEVNAHYSVMNLDTGMYYNNKSEQTYQMEGEELETYRSLTGANVRDPYPGLYSGEPAFGYYERFEFADGVPGLIQKSYVCTKVSEEFSLSFYDGQGLGYVVNDKGDILLSSVGKNSEHSYDNIFDIVLNGGSDAGNLADTMHNREAGTFLFDGDKGKYIYTYVPVENVEGWYLVSVVPFSAVMDEANEIIRNSQVTVIFMVAAMVFFLCFLLLNWRSQKEIREKEREIEYNKQQFDIFSTYLANNTDNVYVMLNVREHRVEYVSPNVERVLGIPAEQILENVDSLECTWNQEGRKLDLDDLAALEPGSSITDVMRERIHKKTGERRWFRESLYSTLLQGERKVILYLSDRTSERKTQDTLTQALDMAQVANKAKSAFLGNVSHDIRTPMNAITGLVSLLREEADNPEHVLEYTHQINAASQHLLGLINDVLDMNKIEGGNATLNITDIDISEIIEELNVIIRPQSRAKNQSFRIFATPFDYEYLLGDKLRICQVLINILSNAVKYTPENGSIEMYVNELTGVTEGYSRVEFVIRDNGQGMSKEYLEVIFDPFTREQNLAAGQIQGTGLGMAITKNLVDLMGGTIEVESELGAGSIFRLQLDLPVCEASEEDPAFWKKYGIRRMIVADDDEYVCRNIVKAMECTGVEVSYATSGRQAVSVLRSARKKGEPYDLMLLDWKMPDQDGLETARLIRKNEPDHIPVIFFTSYDWEEIEEEALKAGVSHFLAKPFFMHSFKDAIERAFDGGESEPSVKPAEKEKEVFEGKHILVVDDIEINQMILVKLLESMGAAVCDVAENGQAAVDRFTESIPGEYDVIFMDVQMPVLDGYGATRAIRASGHPSAKSVPIIAMTANAFVDDIRAAIESGMDAHVSKPVVVDQLKATFQEVLERKRKK